MDTEFYVALFLMGVGLSVAGAGANLYEAMLRTPAQLSYYGRTYLASLGNLFVSFICGPYIMLKMGLWTKDGQPFSMTSAAIASLVAFGWAFITGLFLMSLYFAVIGA